ERILDQERGTRFDIGEYVAERRPDICALPLHWHFQSYDAIEVCKKIKANHPETHTVLGGFTAGYFGASILQDFACVDSVVQGHGEVPMLALARELGAREMGSLAYVPSLHWRDRDGALRTNADVYFSRGPDLARFHFTKLPLMRNWESYRDFYSFPLLWSVNQSIAENRAMHSLGAGFFPLALGRGCPIKCSWCGGGHAAHKRIYHSGGVFWRPVESAVESIRELVGYGYKMIHLCFDPAPKVPKYHLELFKRIREEGLEVGCYFESWSIPTEELCESFAATFDPKWSTMAISPESAVERVRDLNRGFPFPNDAFYKIMDRIKEIGLGVDVFFNVGMPGETLADAMETYRMIEDLRARFPNIKRLMTWSIQLEPASPQFEDPARFGIETDRKSFLDFYRCHGGDHADAYSALGYNNPTFFDPPTRSPEEYAARLQELKCRSFCFLSPNPAKSWDPESGRAYCAMRTIMWKMRGAGERPTTPRPHF
ncbi:MAG: radical SAM protein, partial [Candidatus Methylomirabilis sp.]|nr:radical SAM protein [Deltaproteobacteria bacterium]